MDASNTVDITKLSKLERTSYWHKVAICYLPDSYYENAHTPESPEILSLGELIVCVLKGVLHKSLYWTSQQATRLSIVVSALIFVAFLGAWIYNAFMPALHAAITAVTGLYATISAAIAWLGLFGTAIFSGFLGIGILCSVIIVGNLSHNPDDVLTEWSEWAIYGVVGLLYAGFSVISSAINNAAYSTIGENIWNKLTTPVRAIKRKLETPVIIE